jgi:hypothetical protein
MLPKDDGQDYFRSVYADAFRAKGRFAEALEQDRLGLAHPEKAESAWALTGVGEDLLALGRPAEAIAPLERGWALRDTISVARGITSELALARALWESGGDRRRAIALAEDARARCQPVAARYGSYYAAALARIEAWLATHRQ